MKYKFKNLAPLCKSIRLQKKSIEQFEITYNNVTFDCVLDIGINPFELMIGVKRHNFACVLHIHPGYIVEMDDLNYHILCQILNLNYKDNHFTSFAFFTYLDDHVPAKASASLVDPIHLIPFRESSMSLEERKEGYIFAGWLSHEGKNNGHVRNDSKTEKLLGKTVADYCRKHDISSKWTTNPEKRVILTFPN